MKTDNIALLITVVCLCMPLLVSLLVIPLISNVFIAVVVITSLLMSAILWLNRTSPMSPEEYRRYIKRLVRKGEYVPKWVLDELQQKSGGVER